MIITIIIIIIIIFIIIITIILSSFLLHSSHVLPFCLYSFVHTSLFLSFISIILSLKQLYQIFNRVDFQVNKDGLTIRIIFFFLNKLSTCFDPMNDKQMRENSFLKTLIISSVERVVLIS